MSEANISKARVRVMSPDPEPERPSFGGSPASQFARKCMSTGDAQLYE
jgi:hypothetical protein